MAEKFFVTGDQYFEIDGKIVDLRRQLRSKGGSPLDPSRLSVALDWLNNSLQCVVEARFGDLQPPVFGKAGALAETVPAPTTPARCFPELIGAPEQLLANCRAWNETHRWGFSPGDFQKLPNPPKVPDEPFCALVLTPCPPDEKKVTGLQRGFDELWSAAVSQQPNAWRWYKLLSDPNHLQLLEGVAYAPGLFWEVIDLGAHWDREGGIAPRDVRDPRTSPHLGVLAAIAHYPRYVPTMDGASRSFLWIPGLRVTVPGSGPWQSVPYVDWRVVLRRVRLSARWGGDRLRWSAVPVRREK